MSGKQKNGRRKEGRGGWEGLRGGRRRGLHLLQSRYAKRDSMVFTVSFLLGRLLVSRRKMKDEIKGTHRADVVFYDVPIGWSPFQTGSNRMSGVGGFLCNRLTLSKVFK